MSTYVVGDIHGHLNEWLQLRDKIELQDSDAKFTVLGDIIDRGNQTLETIDWFKEHSSKSGKYQLLMGNHEYMKIQLWDEYIQEIYGDYAEKFEVCKEDKQALAWLNEDTAYKLPFDNYGFMVLYGGDLNRLKSDIDFFRTLPFYKEVRVKKKDASGRIRLKAYVIAHADIPYSMIDEKTYKLKPMEELTDKEKEYIVWNRDVYEFNKMGDTTLIHGHTPTVMGDAFMFDEVNPQLGRIYKRGTKINIDCGLAYDRHYSNTNLAAIRLGDEQEFYLYEHKKN